MGILKYIKDSIFTSSTKKTFDEDHIRPQKTELTTENELLKKELNLLKKIESELQNMQSKKQQL